jgi:poly(3-hydroxybutyrate) depolymerase
MEHRGRRVDPRAIHRVALLTVEGELDDITGMGQTQAAHTLCRNIPDHMRADYVQPSVGHYGVFNGSRFRSEIAPRMTDFMLTHDHRARRKAAPVAVAASAPAAEIAAPVPAKASLAEKSKPAAKAQPKRSRSTAGAEPK